MDYVARSQLEEHIVPKALEALSAKLEDARSRKNLATNDALMALAVYAIRDLRKETAEVSEFGYQTWWLTNESMMLRFTHELEESHGESRYMMRPDFLLNYLSLPLPQRKRAEPLQTFPTLLSIRLQDGMDEEDFQGMMKKVQGWSDWESGRKAAAVGKLSESWKSDFRKQYLTEIPSEAKSLIASRSWSLRSTF